MKLLLAALMIISTQAFAAPKCDLNVKVSEYINVKTERVLISNYTVANYPESMARAAEAFELQLIKQCEDQGAVDCELASQSISGDIYQQTIEMSVQGTKTTGERLSKRKYAKAVKAAVCARIDSCINDAVTDEGTTKSYLDKLYSIQEAKDCN